MSGATFYNCIRWSMVLPLFALFAFTGSACSKEIYAYVDSQGRLMVSGQKLDSRFVKFEPTKHVTARYVSGKTSWIVPKAVTVSFRPVQPKNTNWLRAMNTFGSDSGRPQKYASLIDEIAREVGLDANLLHAVIQVESAYNPLAISPKGAQGLMQLIPATAARFGVSQSFEPAENIRGGARYLKNLLTLFDNDLQLALAAYNAGEGAVKKYNNSIPPYPETQAYVTRVLSLFGQHRN